MVNARWEDCRSKGGSQIYSLSRWHGCLQALRQYLRGWNWKLIGAQILQKQILVSRVEEIDVAAESRLLNMDEWEERIQLEKQLEDIFFSGGTTLETEIRKELDPQGRR